MPKPTRSLLAQIVADTLAEIAPLLESLLEARIAALITATQGSPSGLEAPSKPTPSQSRAPRSRIGKRLRPNEVTELRERVHGALRTGEWVGLGEIGKRIGGGVDRKRLARAVGALVGGRVAVRRGTRATARYALR